MDTLLGVKELADYLKVPPATIYRWNYLGTGPLAVRVGRYVRYRPRDVEAWLEANECRAAHDAADCR